MAISKVTLRRRAVKDNKISLYLDYYPPIRVPETMKESRRESLGIYIYKSPKNQIALDYVQREFAPYVTDDNLKRLLHNIELYAVGAIDNPHPILVKELSNNDLYHFGWNIHNHFRAMNQLLTAQFIKSVFSHSLMNVTDINTIRKKFRNEEATLIKLRCNLSPNEE